MDRIKLTRSQKAALRHIALDCAHLPDEMSESQFAYAVARLESKGLAHAAWASGHELCSVELTEYGRTYLQQNPHLHNPIDWSKAAAIAAIIFALIGAITLLVACRALMN